jgi:hypothetical protein
LLALSRRAGLRRQDHEGNRPRHGRVKLPDCAAAYDAEKKRTPEYAKEIEQLPSVISYPVTDLRRHCRDLCAARRRDILPRSGLSGSPGPGRFDRAAGPVWSGGLGWFCRGRTVMPRLARVMPGLLAALVPVAADARNGKCRNRGVTCELGETSCCASTGAAVARAAR